MINSVNEYIKKYKEESGKTLNLLKCITDESMSQSITDGHRDIGRISWNIAQTIPEMMAYAGLSFGGYVHNAPVPSSAAEIQDAYVKFSSEFFDKLSGEWDDAKLDEIADFYGEKWTLRGAVTGLLLHEIHHRGELSLILGILGKDGLDV